MSKRSLIAGLLVASLALAPRAQADASAEQRAAADALYDEALGLMKAGRWSDACLKLETSQRLDPGIGTLIRLGYCYSEGNPGAGKGRTASAWAAFTEAAGAAEKANDRRAEEAAKQVKLLEPRLSRLLLDVAAENRGPGFQLRRDGKPVDLGLVGSAVPVDPGAHTLEATQPGKEAWTTTIEIDAAKPGVTTVRVPVLVPAAAAEGPPAAAPVATPAAAPVFAWTTQRRAGVGVGSVGLVALGIGGALGGIAMRKFAASKADCLKTQPNVCNSNGLAQRRTVGTMADASTGMLIAGGTALATAIVVFVVAPADAGAKSGGVRRIQASPVAGAGTAGLLLRGEW